MNTKKSPIEEDPKERIRSIKAFSKMTNIIWSFISTMLLGIIVGYLFNIWFEGNNWMLICIIVFFVIAIINFYRQLLKFK